MLTQTASSLIGPAVRRLSTLANLDQVDLFDLEGMKPEKFSAHQEIVREGDLVKRGGILLSGWAYRVKLFSDGRRQILGFLLPGDLIDISTQQNLYAATTIVSLTEVSVCTAPAAGSRPRSGLAEAYCNSNALERLYLFRNVARLGRFNAYERLIDWFLEIQERLSLAGIVHGDAFSMPLIQEVIADALGLTSVHLNRTLQTIRREGLLEFRNGIVQVRNARLMSALVEFESALTRILPTCEVHSGNWKSGCPHAR